MDGCREVYTSVSCFIQTYADLRTSVIKQRVDSLKEKWLSFFKNHCKSCNDENGENN